MAKFTFCALVFGLFVLLNIAASLANAAATEEDRIIDCLYEADTLACAKNRVDSQLNAIEQQLTGRSSSVPFSQVFEEAGAIVVDGTRSLLGQTDESTDGLEDDDEGSDEGRGSVGQARKKFGKKKKKMLQKLLAFGMLIKSKISLLLQIIGTHFQLKFFAIAVIGLIINIARFWIDIKKEHTASKVVYYEHAQHQHHYDHDDDHGGYWGRADQEYPAQELAYSAHK